MKILALVGIVLLMGCKEEAKQKPYDGDPSKVAMNETN